MNKLYIITGPAGVGKSTISKSIAESMNKSALIEGDDIYHLVIGGYVSPWKDGNHLDIFWQNAIILIKNFLENGYDVVFNYIVYQKDLEKLKLEFKDYNFKFIVLLTDEQTIIDRDNLRPVDCRMGERSIILLNKFKDQNYDHKYVLDTSLLSIEETANIIINEDRFKIT